MNDRQIILCLMVAVKSLNALSEHAVLLLLEE